MQETIKHAIHTGAVIHLVGGSDTHAEELVEEIRTTTDSEEMLRISCSSETTVDDLPTARVPDGTLVYYKDFGELPKDPQVTAAQCIKGHFEYGLPVVVRSSEDARGDLTLRNGDLRGRVRSVELDDPSKTASNYDDFPEKSDHEVKCGLCNHISKNESEHGRHLEHEHGY